MSNYSRIAILAMAPGADFPAMISARARGVLRIVEESGRVPYGDTLRSYGRQVEAAMVKETIDLNGECVGRALTSACA